MTDTEWRRHLGRLLTGGEVEDALGERMSQRRLLALPDSAREPSYPAFQFDEDGQPYEVMPPLLEAFDSARLDPHTIASWFVTRPTERSASSGVGPSGLSEAPVARR